MLDVGFWILHVQYSKSKIQNPKSLNRVFSGNHDDLQKTFSFDI